MYYLRNKERGYLGNSPLWWAKAGAGYTDNLDRAEMFTKDDAAAKVKSDPEKWEAWACAAVDKCAYRTFDSQDFTKIRGTGGPDTVIQGDKK